MANTWIPQFLKDMAAYITNPNVGGMYGMWDSSTPGDVNGPFGPGVPGEGGVDLTSAIGTPVYALATGLVEGAGYWKDQGHGVVTTRINVPGSGMEDLYYQHIILSPGIKEGMTVQKGQQIGTTGQYGEVELGFNANWGQPWGNNHPAGWVQDPRPMLAALMNAGPPGTGTDQTVTTSFGQQGSGSPPQDCCGGDMGCNICRNMISVVGGDADAICCGAVSSSIGNQLGPAVNNYLTKTGLVIFGAAIVLIALILMFRSK